MFQRVLYAIFLGFLICMFVVWAMAAWFPTPEWRDEYPGVERREELPRPPSSAELNYLGEGEAEIRMQEYEADRAAYREWDATHEDMEREFDKKIEAQAIPVALISMLIAVIVTSAGLLYSSKLKVVAEGMLLGGIFTLLYSIGWCFVFAPTIAVLAVGIGLVFTVIMGYFKYVRNPADTN